MGSRAGIESRQGPPKQGPQENGPGGDVRTLGPEVHANAARIRVILFASVAYALLRAGLLHLRFDALAMPNYEIGLMGNLARALQLGGGPPIWAYYDNCGGHILEGLLAWPLFEALGPNYLTLKAIPLALGWLTMLALGSIAVRLSDERARLPAMLLFGLTPPTLVQYSMLAKGNHFEATFYQAIALLVFIRWHQRGGGRGGLVLIGFLAGLSVTAYAGSLLLCTLMAFTHGVLRGPRRFLRDLRPAAPGAILGVAPLVWIQVRTGGRVLAFLTDKFEGRVPGSANFELAPLQERALEFGGKFLPAAGGFEDFGPIPSEAFSWAFLGAWILAIVVVGGGAVRFPRARHLDRGRPMAGPLALPLVLGLPAFAAAYAITHFDIDLYHPPVAYGTWRYFVPTFAFAAPILAVAYARLRSRGSIPRALGYGILGSAGLGAIPTLALLDTESPPVARGADYEGFHFEHLSRVLCRSPIRTPGVRGLRWDREQILREFIDLPPPACFEVARGLGHTFALAQFGADRDGTPSIDLDALIEGMPVRFHRELARGAGSFLGRVLRDRPDVLDRILHGPAVRRHPLRAQFIEGLAIPYGFTLRRSIGNLIGQIEEVAGGLRAEDRGDLIRGLGLTLGELAQGGREDDVERIHVRASRLEPAQSNAFYRGVGAGFAASWRDPRWPDGIARGLSDSERLALIEGLATGLASHRDDLDSPRLRGDSALAPGERSLLQGTWASRGNSRRAPSDSP